MVEILPLPCAISELFAQVTASGEITLADRYGILAVLLYESASGDELDSINRLLYALRKGRVRVINRLSTVR